MKIKVAILIAFAVFISAMTVFTDAYAEDGSKTVTVTPEDVKIWSCNWADLDGDKKGETPVIEYSEGFTTANGIDCKEANLTHPEVKASSIALNIYPNKEIDGKSVEFKYITVKYKIVTDDASKLEGTSPRIAVMVRDAANTKDIAKYTGVYSSSTEIIGEWNTAVFKMPDGIYSDETNKTVKRISLFPAYSTSEKFFADNTKFFISDIAFLTENPIPESDFFEIDDDAIVISKIGVDDVSKWSCNWADLDGDKKFSDKTVEYAEGIKSVDGVESKEATLLLPQVNAGAITLNVFPETPVDNTDGTVKYIGIKFKVVTNDRSKLSGTVPRLGVVTRDAANTKDITKYSNSRRSLYDTCGEWVSVFFPIPTGSYSKDADNKIMRLNFYPMYTARTDCFYGSDTKFYISDISFYGNNPDPNAEYIASFKNDNAFAKIALPSEIAVKANDTYTLPENAVSLYEESENKRYVLTGWKSSADGAVYKAGDAITMGKEDVIYTAVFRDDSIYDNTVMLNLTEYINGIVSNRKTATLKNTFEDSVSCVEATPMPEEAQNSNIGIDGYSYTKARLKPSLYKYISLVVKVPMCADGEKAEIGFYNHSGATSILFYVESNEVLKGGEWNLLTFDCTEAFDANIPTEAQDNYIKQIFILPLGKNIDPKNMTPDDKIYLAKLIFDQQKNGAKLHMSYVKGYTNGTFKPTGNMTRAEACTAISRILTDEAQISGTPSFTDVAEDSWYAKYIGFCEERGLLTSFSGEFYPDKKITRAEFAELVYKTSLAKGNVASVEFTDVPTTHVKYASIAAAASSGLINGYEDKTFRPDNTITRAEVVTVINRALERSIGNDGISTDIPILYSDVDTGYWAYSGIVESTVSHLEADGKWTGILTDIGNLLKDTVNTALGNEYIIELDSIVSEKASAIRNTQTAVNAIGEKYYVSNSGSDTNDGLSPETAWATVGRVNKATLNSGDGVFFNRGDLWRGEQILCRSGVTYSAYGTGDKPKFYASPENAAYPEAWKLDYSDDTGKKIWVYTTDENLYDVGAIVFNDGESFAAKAIPSYANGQFVLRGNRGVAFDYKIHLEDNMMFSDCQSKIVNGVPQTYYGSGSVGKLYLRCDRGNPGELYRSIELNVGYNIFEGQGTTGFVLDNLCIKYTGRHGVHAYAVDVKSLVVQNCEIGWIGGGIQNYTSAVFGDAVRLGNGVEIFCGSDEYKVDNCYIYQCYDAGVTHQYGSSGENDVVMNNVTYSNNLIEDCTYAIEYFLNSSADNSNAKRCGTNIAMDNNILRRAGFGFGNTRPDPTTAALINGWNSQNRFENFTVTNNVFDRSSMQLLRTPSEKSEYLPDYEGNTYVDAFGANLGFYGVGTGTKYSYDALTAYTVKTAFGDTSAVVYFCD